MACEHCRQTRQQLYTGIMNRDIAAAGRAMREGIYHGFSTTFRRYDADAEAQQRVREMNERAREISRGFREARRY
jgi:hypothetical protein